MEQFELHLFECKKCRQNLAMLSRISQIMQFDRDYYQQKTVQQPVFRFQFVVARIATKYAPAALLLFVLIFGIYLYVNQPDYYELASLSDEAEMIRLKSDGVADDFSTAVNDMQQKKYAKAIDGFERHLQTDPRNFQANYLLGLAHLAKGEITFLGIHHFSKAHTKACIRYLQVAEGLAGDNQFYREECLWLLGKGWLRLGDKARAKEAWKKILALPSPDLIHKSKVEALLKQLN